MISVPLWIISARKTTRERSDDVESERAETPNAKPSARACITRPRVNGYALFLLSVKSGTVGVSTWRNPGRPMPCELSKSPSSASNWSSGDPSPCFAAWRGGGVPCVCEWGDTSCSRMSMNVKPRRRESAIFEVGSSAVGCPAAIVSIPLCHGER